MFGLNIWGDGDRCFSHILHKRCGTNIGCQRQRKYRGSREVICGWSIKGIILYNVPLEDALCIAKRINQESIVYKAKNKTGIYYTDGSVDMELDNRALSFDAKDDQGTKLGGKLGTQIADMWCWDNNHPKGEKSHYIFTAYAGRPNSWKHGKIIDADTANLGISYSEIFRIYL